MARGGSRPNTGGARPGAGRKSKATEDYQLAKRAVVQQVVTDEEWRKVIDCMLGFAKAGNVQAFKELVPWVMGKVPDQIDLHATGEVVFVPWTPRVAQGEGK